MVTIPFNRINVTPFELNEGIGSDIPNGSVKIIAKLQSKGLIKRTADIIYNKRPTEPFTLKSLPRLLSFSWCCKWPVLKEANPLQFLVQSQRNRTSLGLVL